MIFLQIVLAFTCRRHRALPLASPSSFREIKSCLYRINGLPPDRRCVQYSSLFHQNSAYTLAQRCTTTKMRETLPTRSVAHFHFTASLAELQNNRRCETHGCFATGIRFDRLHIVRTIFHESQEMGRDFSKKKTKKTASERRCQTYRVCYEITTMDRPFTHFHTVSTFVK